MIVIQVESRKVNRDTSPKIEIIVDDASKKLAVKVVTFLQSCLLLKLLLLQMASHQLLVITIVELVN